MDEGQRRHLETLRENYRKRLRVLEQRAAVSGYSTPPEVLTEIDDIKTEIERINTELGENILQQIGKHRWIKWIALGVTVVLLLLVAWRMIPSVVPEKNVSQLLLPSNSPTSNSALATTIPSATVFLPMPSATLPLNTIPIPLRHNSIKIDGSCDSINEYHDANSFTFRDYQEEQSIVYFQNDGKFIYVCVNGSLGTNPNRFITVEFSNDRGDAGSMIMVRGEPANSNTLASKGIVDWLAKASTGTGDTAEFRVPIVATTGNPCDKVFRMSIWHYWVTRPGDDYVWPSGALFKTPGTWSFVSLECKK